MARKTIEHYEILRKLARGGMAELFLARTVGPEGFEKLLVLKKILPSYADWQIVRPPAPGGKGRARNAGFTAVMPARRMDTDDSASN